MDDVIDFSARLHRKSHYLVKLRSAIEESERIVRILEDHARSVTLAGGVLPESVEEALIQRNDLNAAALLRAAEAVETARKALSKLEVPSMQTPGVPSLMVLEACDDSLEAHPSLTKTADTPYRRGARVRQARWRERRNLPPGVSRGAPDLAMLSMPAARMRLDNFISGPVRNMVRRYALGPKGVRPGYGVRFFSDLLDTRALAFNLFGELARDTELATAVLRDWVPDMDRVLRVDLDYRPTQKRLGRVLNRDWRAPLHACVNYVDPEGDLGFIGCVVLYAEPRGRRRISLTEDERSLLTGLATLNIDDVPLLEQSVFSRLGRAYLTCGGLLHSDIGYVRGQLWALHANDDHAASKTIQGFSELLSTSRSFRSRSLESITRRIANCGKTAWASTFDERYLVD